MRPTGTTERQVCMTFTDTQRRLLYGACSAAATMLRMNGGVSAERDALELEELGRDVLGFLEPSA